MKVNKITETHTVKSVEVIKSEYNSGVIDRRNIANGVYDTYLLIRFEGGGYTKVKIGRYHHSNGGMHRLFFLDDSKSEIAELINDRSNVHSSTWGATGTCTMMSMSNEIAPKVAPGDTIKVSGRKAPTNHSWKITHAQVELIK
jgi:hypothetical protein